ncbi:MAG: DoxX family protein [Chitinophagaceae bacterium]|nr:DoxX family protein [Chitinophagaceae bacterium]
MKLLITIIRIIVGVLFIFSGLVKANDPHGLSYKMQEFFELWGVDQFNSFTLALSILMNAFEIIAGFALLIGWRIRLFSWLLLLLILFFTFLTGYTYITGKPTNCGCFGDCIPITSKTSFLKDVALTLMIGFLFWKWRQIRPLFSSRTSAIAMIAVTIFSFGIQWYALNYLPVVDCLPFKKGNNISEKMKSPPGSVPDSFAIVFIYEKGGKEYEFAPADLPDDLDTYKFVKRSDKLVRKGNADPPIKGFGLSGITDLDSTQTILSLPNAILLFCEDFSVPVSRWQDDFVKLYTLAKSKQVPVYAVTTQLTEANAQFAKTPFSDITVLKCDYTAIRTAARANPTVYLLKEGTIEGKWSYRDMNELTDKLGGIQSVPTVVSTDTIKTQ